MPPLSFADIVRLGKRNVNVELVREGWAWWYRKYAPKNKELAEAETAARKAKRDLWAGPKPIPPWDWRQSERERRQKSRSGVDTGYWRNTSTGSGDNGSGTLHIEPIAEKPHPMVRRRSIPQAWRSWCVDVVTGMVKIEQKTQQRHFVSMLA
jgi:hypothetical protein